MLNYKPIECPKCKSKKIFHLRIDSDWGSGIGNYIPVNSKKEYSHNELELDSYDRPDISVYHCRRCDYLWDFYNTSEGNKE